MLRRVMDVLHRGWRRLRKPRTILICPRTGQAAIYDPETDVLDLGDGSYARMSDIRKQLTGEES